MAEDLTGQKFGKITVLGRAPTHGHRAGFRYYTRCDCGEEKIRRTDTIKTYKRCRMCAYKANGDRTRGKARPELTKHGGVGTRLYRIWAGVKYRAKDTRPEHRRLAYRHVDMHEPWDDFAVFKDWAMANGYADDLTIDRIDNAKGYHPDNCRWATRAVQSQNRAMCKFTAESVIEVRKRYADGETLTELAREYETHTSAVYKIVNGKRWKNIEQPRHAEGLGG